jgi:rod shape-determining protein MreD
MSSNFVKLSLLFIFMLLLQVFVLNDGAPIPYSGRVIPLPLYIYFILKLPIGFSRYLEMLLAFVMGFIIDIACMTPGMNAAAATFTAFVRQPVQGLFFQRGDYMSYLPGHSLLKGAFYKYIIVCVLLHVTALLLLERFNHFDYDFFIKIILSTAVTCLIILAIEYLSLKKQNE